MTPVIALVGRSGAGKTTYLQKLIPELNRRGYRVGTIKHAQEIEFAAGKDGEVHLLAGSAATAIATTGRIVMVKASPDPSVDEITTLMGNDFDIILCEGFKQSDVPKIEIHRTAVGDTLTGLTQLFARITDNPQDNSLREFSFDNVAGMAELLEEHYIKPNRNRMSLYVNGNKVTLSEFPERIIKEGLMAMVRTLKKIEAVKTLEIRIKHETEGAD